MRTLIKICGITTPEDARMAVHAGASAIGMIFAESQRQVTIDQAEKICRELPPYVDRVGVFANQSRDSIVEAVEQAGLTRVQLHGEEPAEFCQGLPGALTRALRLDDGALEEELERWLAVRADVQGLVDLPKTDSLHPSQHWDGAAQLARRHPLTLAGGLQVDNVLQALITVRPAAVDVARGVERSPGTKDPTKVRDFCRAVRGFDEVQRPR